MEHFCKVSELTFANTNQSHFEKTKDTSNHSAFITQYTSNHNWLAVVDEQFINDNFNLYGIPEYVPDFLLALKVFKGEININANNTNKNNFNNNESLNGINNDNKNASLNPNQTLNNAANNDQDNNPNNGDDNHKPTEELPDNIEQICIDAYNQVHARFIQTPKGLQIMRRKYEAGIFGICPRFLCNGQNLLPFGSSLLPSKAPARGYCPLCHDIYEADVLIEEQLELQRKNDNTKTNDNGSKDKSDNQGNTKSDTNEQAQNRENTKSINPNSTEKNNDHSDTGSEGKQSQSFNINNENNQINKNNNNDQINANNNNDNDNENANLSESTEVANNNNNNNTQKNEDQNTTKDDQNIQNEKNILDGSCFGPYFPHFFLQMNRDLIPTSFTPSEKTETSNNSVFSTIFSKKTPEWKQVPVPAPFSKTEQMKYTIFGIPIDPNSDFNPHRVVRDSSAFEDS